MSDTEKTEGHSQPSIYSEQVKELVAIGAAIACNCEMCFKFHYDKARKLNVSDDDMSAAVQTALMVKNTPAQAMKDLADKYLKRQNTSSCQCGSKGCCS